MKRKVNAPDKTLLTEREARQWLESQGCDVSEKLWREWIKKGYLVGTRRYNRQTTLYHWKGIVSLLWRVELDDAQAVGDVADSGETGRD